MMGSYPAYVVRSKTETLAYPHYSDPTWRSARLIFGAQVETDESNYADRLREWSRKDAERASAAVEGMDRTVAMWETWLTTYHQRPVVVRYIIAEVSPSTGYAYYFLGYDYVQVE